MPVRGVIQLSVVQTLPSCASRAGVRSRDRAVPQADRGAGVDGNHRPEVSIRALGRLRRRAPSARLGSHLPQNCWGRLNCGPWRFDGPRRTPRGAPPRAPPPAPPRSFLAERGELRSRSRRSEAHLRLPCTPPPKLGEGSTASRGTSDQAGRGRGLPPERTTVSLAPTQLHGPLPRPLPARSSRRGENSLALPAVRSALPAALHPSPEVGGGVDRLARNERTGGRGRGLPPERAIVRSRTNTSAAGLGGPSPGPSPLVPRGEGRIRVRIATCRSAAQAALHPSPEVGGGVDRLARNERRGGRGRGLPPERAALCPRTAAAPTSARRRRPPGCGR
jgi:hypothetical protein